MRLVMRSPQLRRIVAAYTVNRLGGWFGLLALVLAVYDRTHHSALAVSALLAASLAVPALVVPAVVARVEASRRGRELSGLYVFEGIVTAGLAVLLSHFSLLAVLGLVVARRRRRARRLRPAALRGRARGAHLGRGPRRRRRARPGRSRRRRRGGGASRERSLEHRLLRVLRRRPGDRGRRRRRRRGPRRALIDVGSFLLCALMLLDLHPHVENAAGDSVRARLRAARGHIASVPMLRRLFLAEFAALLFIETGAPIEITYVKSTLSRGRSRRRRAARDVGGRRRPRLARVRADDALAAADPARIGSLAIGAAYFGLAAAPSLGLACVAGVVGGIGNGVQWPSMISAVQALTPPDLHGRLMGAAESLGALSSAWPAAGRWPGRADLAPYRIRDRRLRGGARHDWARRRQTKAPARRRRTPSALAEPLAMSLEEAQGRPPARGYNRLIDPSGCPTLGPPPPAHSGRRRVWT